MSECKCDLRTKLVGDGCRYCNPQDYIDHLHDALQQKDTWIGLTEDEAEDIYRIVRPDVMKFWRLCEAKLKAKNAE